MDKAEATKILNRKAASKEQLREALAFALGVAYSPVSGEKSDTLFNRCKGEFCSAYELETGLNYSFGAMDGRSLSELIKKVGKTVGTDNEETVYNTFCALISKLPEWYRINAFSISVINKKYNEIVSSIKKNGGKQRISNNYKERLARELLSE